MNDLPSFGSAVFMWHPTERKFSVEASDLRLPFTQGFYMVSSITQKAVLCRPSGVEQDVEGDILVWNFRPEGHNFTVVVFND